MKYSLLILFFTSFIISSDFKSWIDSSSDIINTNKYLVDFSYYTTKSKNKVEENIKNATYYSINQDSSILKLDDRIILFGKESSTVISLSSKQIFKEKKNYEFDEFKDKILSIFLTDKYKLIKISKNEHILSLNDYFLNLDVSYYHKDNSNPQISMSFFQNPYIINVQDIVVANYDSIPYTSHIWGGYEVFNLSE